MKRFGSAGWSGNLRNGKGTVSTKNLALDSYPYTFFSRYGEKPGTNPEELLGAAHIENALGRERWPGLQA
jgi:osmotically inducible protein OsmC